MTKHNLDVRNEIYSEKELEKNVTFFDEMNWISISSWQNLSESFIEKYKHKVNWLRISQRQKLSEEFIEKHKDKVDWYFISMRQKLSEGFIKNNINKIDIECLMVNINISTKIKQEIRLLKEII